MFFKLCVKRSYTEILGGIWRQQRPQCWQEIHAFPLLYKMLLYSARHNSHVAHGSPNHEEFCHAEVCTWVSIAFTDTISIILPIVSNPEEFGLNVLQAGRSVIFTCCHYTVKIRRWYKSILWRKTSSHDKELILLEAEMKENAKWSKKVMGLRIQKVSWGK